MTTNALWFGIVAIALAVTPAHAQRKVDWSEYIDQRAVANANAPVNAAPASNTAAAPASKKAPKKVAKAAKAKKTKAKARAAKKARRK